jgi:LmbE family N-acetylglucosaminyl deacetylase
MGKMKRAFAIGAHPDDVEFMVAGILILLKQAGYEPHIMTVATGSCGTVEHDREEIVKIREQEAKDAAGIIGAIYHPGFVDDIQIYYEPDLLARISAIIREVDPEIILIPSLRDYMYDHENTGRLVITAAFSRGMKNFLTKPKRDPVKSDVYIYHALPYGLRDGLRRIIIPGGYVNISSVVEEKQKMLACHKTQQLWLDTSQGMNKYLRAMREMSATVAKMSGQDWSYAEGFVRHNYLGFSSQDKDILKEILPDKVVINQKYEEEFSKYL